MPVPNNGNHDAYWKANLRLVAGCLVVWFTVSFGLGILLVEQLNRFQFFGFKLGFWFAQQGSIFVFLLLVFFYAYRMNALDRKFGVSEQENSNSPSDGNSDDEEGKS
jgi:putative solute:sodium symporter small subunit